MAPEELWDIFEEAYLQCPQARSFDDDVQEIGQYETYGSLKSTIYSVISYWLDPTTIGGSTLFDSNYLDALDPTVLETCIEYRVRLNQYKIRLSNELFVSVQ